jgi:glucoamylase
VLIIALPLGARIERGINGWRHIADGEPRETGLGLHRLELDAAAWSQAQQIDFSFHWHDTQLWEGKEFHVAVGTGPTESID